MPSSSNSTRPLPDPFVVAVLNASPPSEFDLDVALGGVDAGANGLALGPADLARAQVPHLARLQREDAGVADPLATAVGQVEPLLLAGHHDRRLAVGDRLAVRLREDDLAAIARLAGAKLGLEALHV